MRTMMGFGKAAATETGLFDCAKLKHRGKLRLSVIWGEAECPTSVALPAKL